MHCADQSPSFMYVLFSTLLMAQSCAHSAMTDRWPNPFQPLWTCINICVCCTSWLRAFFTSLQVNLTSSVTRSYCAPDLLWTQLVFSTTLVNSKLLYISHKHLMQIENLDIAEKILQPRLDGDQAEHNDIYTKNMKREVDNCIKVSVQESKCNSTYYTVHERLKEWQNRKCENKWRLVGGALISISNAAMWIKGLADDTKASSWSYIS